MKKGKAFFSLAVCVLMFSFPAKVFPWAVGTHQSIFDKVINSDSDNLDPNIKKILKDNESYARAGAFGPDLFNYCQQSKYNSIGHYCEAGKLAKKMLEMAKTPQEKAFAYGWMIHVASDMKGHPWVNKVVEQQRNLQPGQGEYHNGNAIRHTAIELAIDRLNIDPGLLGAFHLKRIDIPHKFVSNVFEAVYGCKDNSPAPYTTSIVANTVGQILQNHLPLLVTGLDKTGLNNAKQYDTADYRDAYAGSVTLALDALENPNILENKIDLDTGLDSNQPGYTGDEKCEQFGKLKDCSPVKKPIKTGDFPPDDTVSVSGYDGVTGTGSLDSLYRLAPKKGKKWMLWLKAAQDANAEYNGLPADAPIELVQEKLDKISALVSQLNDPLNGREFSANNPQLFGEIEETPDIAVLENGYFEEMTGLINKQKEAVRTVPLDFSPQILETQPVLIIPSGGLYGLEKTEIIKASLDEYVKQGGILIVFSQQYGYEFSILPVPQEADGSYRKIGGYGWAEDQSCFVNAAYIETWHQMLAGLRKGTPDIHIDGYLMHYPSNATVLLRRTANGQPALLMYEYGEGRVIVTSMYSDVALKQNQASSEEIGLIRDIISWAKAPDQLPEVKPGQSAPVSVTVRKAYGVRSQHNTTLNRIINQGRECLGDNKSVEAIKD